MSESGDLLHKFAAAEREPPECPYYGKPCPNGGTGCLIDEDQCAFEDEAERDEKADRGDWEYHQRRDGC